jgi:3-hydroxyisobutyrate dehydrogenase-like beta-hydroxyacid dehydrogenase
MATALRAGLVGLGNMGKGMAKNIAKCPSVAGLYVSEVNEANVKQFFSEVDAVSAAKVTVCRSLATMTQDCQLIGLSLPSEQSTVLVLFGKDGIIEAKKKSLQPLIVFDHGTFSREFVLDNHQRAKSAGVLYIDAPVSGGPGGADAGTLTIMAGGDTSTITECEKLWRTYSSNVFHFGDIGCGMAAKLINQALVGVHAQAACEALYLAEEMNITNIEALREMLNTAWGQSKILDLTMTDYIRAQQEGWQTVDNSKAPLRNLEKDFKCIIGKRQLDSQGKFPLIEATDSFIADAQKRGLQNSAFVALIKRLR